MTTSETPPSSPPAKISQATVMRHERYSGPVAHPAIAQGWEDTLEGSANRLLTMAETQSAHRQTLETKIVDGRNVSQIMGTLFAGTIAIIGIIAGYNLLMADKPISGFTSMLTPLGVIVIAFLHVNKSKGDASK